MKRALVFLALMLPTTAWAQNPALSTAANDTLRRMFTQIGSFGFPAYAADPFTCNATTKRTTYYKTTDNLPYFCNGTAWTAMGGLTSPVAGDFVATGKWTWGTALDAANTMRLGETAGCIVFEGATADGSETTLCGGDALADGTFTITAGTGGIITLTNSVAIESASQVNLSGPDATTNVEIGATANDANGGTGGTSIAIGNAATVASNGANNIVIGSSAQANASSTGAIVIGQDAQNNANDQNVCIGRSVRCQNNGTIAIGAGATTTANPQIVIGMAATGAAVPIVLGHATVTGASAAATVIDSITVQGGTGSNIGSNSLALKPGPATGNAVSGNVQVWRGIQGASGSSAQTQAPGIIVCPAKVLSTTSATAQTIATITTTSTTGGTVTMDYGNLACSGSTCDSDSGLVKVSWNNNAGTVAATMTAVTLQSDSDATGTLAATPTATVATNVVSIKLTPTWATIVPTSVLGYATFFLHSSGDTVVCQ